MKYLLILVLAFNALSACAYVDVASNSWLPAEVKPEQLKAGYIQRFVKTIDKKTFSGKRVKKSYWITTKGLKRKIRTDSLTLWLYPSYAKGFPRVAKTYPDGLKELIRVGIEESYLRSGNFQESWDLKNRIAVLNSYREDDHTKAIFFDDKEAKERLQKEAKIEIESFKNQPITRPYPIPYPIFINSYYPHSH